ncbi:LysE family transporter [Mucilaginibacter paludis]|uniref:Lysine exporter protein (LYSE/YGGA) n=1 Tax=Mucilaginibacter paludis DSM 18603 TaxID=714943 RepID=H1YFW8_9SPHI|nr:LysE family transporter [Mucilaginibacter paludis]EHQ25359.1 Lysine exporter protein (LYSE/YGGA) [Mucilaginibacter paludis DSM 18603]
MIFLTFILGLVVNFIGYVPPGNINLTLAQIAINRGNKQAMYFISAFSCVEFFFTWFIIHAANWLSGQLKLNIIIDWVMIVVFSALAITTWINRNKAPKTDYSKYQSIKYGIILGFVNPMQIPFWMISGTYLITHGWILTGTLPLIIFSLGSASGAFLCLYLYARSANYIQAKFELSNRIINTCIAALFFLFAAYHLVKQIYLLFFKH